MQRASDSECAAGTGQRTGGGRRGAVPPDKDTCVGGRYSTHYRGARVPDIARGSVSVLFLAPYRNSTRKNISFFVTDTDENSARAPTWGPPDPGDTVRQCS
jgi:hypothetical protein